MGCPVAWQSAQALKVQTVARWPGGVFHLSCGKGRRPPAQQGFPRFSVPLLRKGHILAEEGIGGAVVGDDSSRLMYRPPRREHLGLLQDGLHGGVL